MQVTATRFGEPIQEVPQSISVVTGDEIRDRGATDLRTALALLSGVSISPLRDAGPAAPVLASELGEGQFHRLTARRYKVALTSMFQ